jgi:DNA polymerase iota
MDQIINDESDSSSCDFNFRAGNDIEESEQANLLKRYIIHLDVDCFYCQAEEIRNPALASKPLAIGQKHIIVTSNYVARKMGVKKLQGRRDALRACPSLIIVEGSDLEPYREASRLIYSAFRAAVKELDPRNSTRKGGMDECFADITASVNNEWGSDVPSSLNYGHTRAPLWIYGDDASAVRITEDQSGASSISIWQNTGDIGKTWGTKEERKNYIEKMLTASKVARHVQDQVKAQTSFSTTIGISSSPMLAKLASDLKKPKSCNVLYPWRSENMIANMPLRRIPDLGSKSLHLLTEVLKKYNQREDCDGTEFWTCQDLLNVPRHVVLSCLEKNKSNCSSHLLLSRCRGIDTAIIEDDGGSLPKTISAEDSFVRGSLTCMVEVMKNLEILFSRLMRLLERRKEVSKFPQLAYPRAIRLTARIVDHSVTTNRRSFRNISKQTAFSGKVLMNMKTKDEQIAFLKHTTLSLLEILKKLTVGLNITRLNVAAISFADIETTRNTNTGSSSHSLGKQGSLMSFFQNQNNNISKPAGNLCDKIDSRNVHDARNMVVSSQKGDEACQMSISEQSSMRHVIQNLKRKESERCKKRKQRR